MSNLEGAMMKVTLTERQHGTPQTKDVDVEMPALPRAGDFCCHERSGVQGTVQNVQFWWSEDGSPLQIEVQLKRP